MVAIMLFISPHGKNGSDCGHSPMSVRKSLPELLSRPAIIPELRRTRANAKKQNLSVRDTRQPQLLQRRRRAWQDQRLPDDYHSETINLVEAQGGNI
jgi:hypothetical protein